MFKIILSRLTYNMIWTDKGPKYLLIVIISSLVIYMTYAMFYLNQNQDDSFKVSFQ